MSKPSRDTQLRRGEVLLAAWAIAADAGVGTLRDLTGRDPAADLAIAARLGAHAEPASVEALLALERGCADKLVRKEVRRSLYRLEQRGLSIPQTAPPEPPRLGTVPEVEGYVSPVDGNGDQIIWLVKPRAGGVSHVFAVVNYPDGLREVELTPTTRKALREIERELMRKHELRFVKADWRYCCYLIDRAFHRATEAGRQVGGDYQGIRRQLLKEPPAVELPLIVRYVDLESVRGNAQLLADSARLLEEKEFYTWFFDHNTLKPYIDETLRIRDSPLVLNQIQQEERFRALGERAVEELFGGEHRDGWICRLQEMAYFLYATRRAEQAKQALAVALALENSTHGGRDIPFCEQLARTSLVAHLQVEEQREQEQASNSLIITPQQAMREAQQHRQR